jgi:hypothetical protein
MQGLDLGYTSDAKIHYGEKKYSFTVKRLREIYLRKTDYCEIHLMKTTIVKSISGKLCQTSLIADGLVQPLLLLLCEGLVQLREVGDASCAAVLSCRLAAAPEPAAPPTTALAGLHLAHVSI